MRHIHLLIEVHCLFEIDTCGENGLVPDFCKYGVKNPGYHCMENKCKFIAYTDAPHEIAYAGKNGEVSNDAWIGFGGDMEPEQSENDEVEVLKKLWEEICCKKIEESYKNYMEDSGLLMK